MATTAQIIANRKNARSSTGPTTEAGKQKVSLNAVRHGLTGSTIYLAPDEVDAYQFHVLAINDLYSPKTHQESILVQDLADSHWFLQQINAMQANTIALIRIHTERLMKSGDLAALTQTLAPLEKTLRNYNLYENRRRRAIDALAARLTGLQQARQQKLAEAAKVAKFLKSQDKPFTPSEFGFVFSPQEIDAEIDAETTRQIVLAATSQPASSPAK